LCPAKSADGATRGYIIPIGGAEAKLKEGVILRRFAKLAGGRAARIVVIPTASRRSETGPAYEALFRDMRVDDASVLRLDDRAACADPATLGMLEQATGVFLTGGSQLRLSATIGGTEVARLLRRRNAAGLHVAGTSAGASFLSEHMIAHGDEGSTPKGGMVSLAPGLGLTNRFIIDQHFRERDRLGRLLTALAFNPFAIGIGLDEDTAAFFGPDERLEVVGSGAITIVDPSSLEFSSIDDARMGQPVSLVGIKLHVLVEGGLFDAHARQARASGDASG
jgi:cyanophycinase